MTPATPRSTSTPNAPNTGAPTKVRYGVLAFACSLSMITYLDRVCFGAAASLLATELMLPNKVADLAPAFSMFALAYAAFEVPSGWLGDVFGPRSTLIRIVVWWSAFTAITGMIGMQIFGFVFGNLPDLHLGTDSITGIVLSLTIIRFLFGMGEAGAYPNITRALHNWFPFSERGFTQGMVWMSGRLMGGLTPLIWGVLVAGIQSEQGDVYFSPLMTWRQAFFFFGVLGLIWCVLFGWWFRNRPEENPNVNAGELALINSQRGDHADHSGVPWGKLFTNANLWILCLMYFCAAYGWYFNITYLPAFLKNHYGVADTSFWGFVYKGGPLWMGAVGCLAGGFLTDSIIRRTGDQRFGRRILGLVGHSLCALCCCFMLFAQSAFTFFLAVSLAAFFNDLTMGSAWATCQDIGRRYAAIVAGCMNTIGNLGGFCAGMLTGKLMKWSIAGKAAELGIPVEQLSSEQYNAAELAGYHVAFITFVVVYGLAVCCWFIIDSTKPVVPDAPADAH